MKNMKHHIEIDKTEDIYALAVIMKSSFKKEPWNESWDEEQCKARLNTLLSIKTSILFSFYEDEELIGGCIGFSLPYEKEEQFQIIEFFLDEKKQGTGLGSLFLNLIEDKLKGMDTILLCTRGSLSSFYSKNGYKITQTVEMEKKL